VCDPVRCTPLASTPKSKLHRRHRPVISRDTRTYSQSQTPTKHSPQNEGESETPRSSRHYRARRGGSRRQGSTSAYNALGSLPVRTAAQVLGLHEKQTSRNTTGAQWKRTRGERVRRRRRFGKGYSMCGTYRNHMHRPHGCAQEIPDRDGLGANTCAPLRILTTLGDCWSNHRPANPDTGNHTTMQSPCSPPF